MTILPRRHRLQPPLVVALMWACGWVIAGCSRPDLAPPSDAPRPEEIILAWRPMTEWPAFAAGRQNGLRSTTLIPAPPATAFESIDPEVARVLGLRPRLSREPAQGGVVRVYLDRAFIQSNALSQVTVDAVRALAAIRDVIFQEAERCEANARAYREGTAAGLPSEVSPAVLWVEEWRLNTLAAAHRAEILRQAQAVFKSASLARGHTVVSNGDPACDALARLAEQCGSTADALDRASLRFRALLF